MISLLLTIFLLQLFIRLINTVLASPAEEVLWFLYTHLPRNPIASSAQKQTTLRKEVVRLKREMTATSSQDQFAKWAKLRRQHDKAVAQYEEITSSLSTHRSTFTQTITTLRFLGTNGLRFLVQWWFAKAALFWLPRGWAPWYGEFLLAFPRAPRGSVSVQVWGGACATVLELGTRAVRAGVGLVQKGGSPGKEKAEGMKMEGREREEKKEL